MLGNCGFGSFSDLNLRLVSDSFHNYTVSNPSYMNAGFHPEVVEVGNRVLAQMRDFDCKVIVEAIIPKPD